MNDRGSFFLSIQRLPLHLLAQISEWSRFLFRSLNPKRLFFRNILRNYEKIYDRDVFTRREGADFIATPLKENELKKEYVVWP